MSTLTQLKEYATSNKQPFSQPRSGLVPTDSPLRDYGQGLSDVRVVQAPKEPQWLHRTIDNRQQEISYHQAVSRI